MAAVDGQALECSNARPAGFWKLGAASSVHRSRAICHLHEPQPIHASRPDEEKVACRYVAQSSSADLIRCRLGLVLFAGQTRLFQKYRAACCGWCDWSSL